MDAGRPPPSRTEDGAQALGLLDDRGSSVSRPTTEEACACQGFESTWATPTLSEAEPLAIVAGPRVKPRVT